MEPAALKLHVEVLPFLNVALYLNDIPFIQYLALENTGETDSGTVALHISCDIPCFETFNHTISCIPAGMEVKVTLTSLAINRQFLTALTESERAKVKLELTEADHVVLTEEHYVSVHPMEYFGGFAVLPELIAAYVTPNHPYVYHIKRIAVEELERQGLRTAFEGYQSNNAERVLQLMSAIYSAIQSEGIVYSSLPPGYEQTGQRLRLLNTIQKEQFGNCLDISLLFAACLEAIDLNPVIIVTKGHAFTGCWLHDNKFAEVVNDDQAAITKRLAKGIRELAVIEATNVCKGSNVRFTDALNQGESQLVGRADFILSVDIKRARTARIRPLPLIIETVTAQEDAVKRQPAETMEQQFDIGTIYQDPDWNEKKPLTKQKVWERKLLDLSLRNNLLNIRMTRNMLQLVDIDLSHLEDTLSEGKSFAIQPDARAVVIKRYNLFMPALHPSAPLFQVANEELKYNRLLSYYHQADLDNILSYIHKNAKQAIEENGASTLYLAVGLLKWFDRKNLEQPRYAPILLLPVEISRRSVNSKFTLKSREEETMINITLLEFLRQEYELNLGALEELPTDDQGVDVAKVMGTLRRAIMPLKGWDVEEQLILGNFSFSKLILWKDIVIHQEQLLQNTIVRSLVEGQLLLDSVDAVDSQMEFDSLSPTAMALPIPTDVSQMEAVYTAQQGKSFVLHGPPGTGKSQTITNIIADALYHGKKVLFVAAKKAALDVVYKRMEHIGLAPFSLELHSNKSKKSDVLAQLARSLDTVRQNRVADYAHEGERLQSLRNDISSYVNVLHSVQPVGWSLYDSVTALQQYENADLPKVILGDAVYQQLDDARWQQWTDWLPQFRLAVQSITHPSDNPLRMLQLQRYSPQVQEDLTLHTAQLLQAFEVHLVQLPVAIQAAHFPFDIQSHEQWTNFAEIVELLLTMPAMPVSLARYLANREHRETYEDWDRLFDDYQENLQQLLAAYHRKIRDIDLPALELQWMQTQHTWFLPKWWRRRALKKQLALYRKTPFATDEQVEALFALSNRLQDTQRALGQTRFDDFQRALKTLYRGEDTDLQAIRQKTTALTELHDRVQVFGTNAFDQWMRSWALQPHDYTDELVQTGKAAFTPFVAHARQIRDGMLVYENASGVKLQDTDMDEAWLPRATARLQGIQSHLPYLKDWMNYLHIREQGESLHLQWFIVAFEIKRFAIASVDDVFYYTVHRSVAEHVIASHEALTLFNASLFANKIAQYKKAAKDFQELTKKELHLKLSSRIPSAAVEAMQSSEIGMLRRAIKNRGRGISIRRLFDQIPTLLPRIAPCMLMSPISVAQYFDVNTEHFDLVIFDEASQLPTCEAISALARAKQAVIVGDPKQMPPTSFFNINRVDEDNMDVEDLESILDDCLALSMPSRYLLRHYRSKHESLISFSNANYYDNKLLTFPSADDLSRKVVHHPVAGFYDKGKTRQNKFEADAIVAYIKSHYRDEQRRAYSLGVVTFSQAQQSLIEDRLQELFSAYPDLEQLASECSEPIFIKNLENVQGDERDIILFSIGYAPDEEGKMSMNFGPINRDGGWRRLNVAVTRARYEMHIFATLLSDRIDLSRTASEGVAGLKAFLHFAERGQLTLRPEDTESSLPDQSLSDTVARRLEAKGLSVRRNIGTSGFKVDVGIVHPDRPHQYLLGVLIDGKYYFDARTTNDRELVMPAVMKSLGWNIYRLWALDWMERADDIVNDIVARVEALKNRTDEGVGVIAESGIDTGSGTGTGLQTTEETDAIPEVAAPEADTEPHSQQSVSGLQRPYIAAVLLPVRGGTSETVYEYQNRYQIEAQIREVVDTEAPISKGLLYKRILPVWNISRAGARLDGYLDDIINEMGLRYVDHHQRFYVSTDVSLTSLKLSHYRANDIEKRDMQDIAPEELVLAIIEAVHHNLSIDEDELLRYVARVFGFAKIGRQIDELVRYAVDMAEREGKVKRENRRVKWDG